MQPCRLFDSMILRLLFRTLHAQFPLNGPRCLQFLLLLLLCSNDDERVSLVHTCIYSDSNNSYPFRLFAHCSEHIILFASGENKTLDTIWLQEIDNNKKSRSRVKRVFAGPIIVDSVALQQYQQIKIAYFVHDNLAMRLWMTNDCGVILWLPSGKQHNITMHLEYKV